MPKRDGLLHEAENMHLVPIGGLCNRLRAIMSHAVAAWAAGEVLYVYWFSHPACPARFDDLFEPIADVRVVVYEGDRVPPAGYIQTCGVHAGVAEADWPLSLLRPVAAIRERVAALQVRLGSDYVAVHIRRTDHNQNWHQDEVYAGWGDGHGGPVYAAADNPKSLATLKRRLGERLVYQGRFAMTGIRMTEVADAVVDLWVCGGAKAFRGTYYSSFSDWIETMRRAAGLAPGDLTKLP